MKFKTFLTQLTALEQLALPGATAHAKMVPPSRASFNSHTKTELKNAKRAGVMALFYPNGTKDTSFVLMLRQSYKGTHSAQVSFPGGQYEAEDGNLKQTALRETYEEMGVPKSDIFVVKELSPVYIPPSNFYVQPYIGYVRHTPVFIPQEDEVKALIEVDLDVLLDDATLITKSVKTSYSAEAEVPAFKLEGHVVWGATAMMLSEVKDLIKQLG